MMNARLTRDGKAHFRFPANYSTVLLVIEGSITINGTEEADTDHLALMANDGEAFEIKAGEDAVVLILSGEPINEPIAAQGPFVMNTKEELMQAFADFKNGKFGHLAD